MEKQRRLRELPSLTQAHMLVAGPCLTRAGSRACLLHAYLVLPVTLGLSVTMEGNEGSGL